MVLSHRASQTQQQQQQAGSASLTAAMQEGAAGAQGKLIPFYDEAMEVEEEQQGWSCSKQDFIYQELVLG